MTEAHKRNLPTNGLAISSLVLGLIAVLISWIPILNFIALLMGVLGIVFALLGIRQIKRAPDEMKGSGRALTGLLLSLSGTVLAIFILVLTYWAITGQK